MTFTIQFLQCSIVEYPSEDTGTIVQQGITPTADTADELSLPASYAIVPAVALNESKASVPARLCYEFHGNLENGILRDRTKSIHDTITKNSLSLFKSPKRKLKSKASQQLVVQRNNTSLFGRLYIANQQREGDPAIFFSHENQSCPPSPDWPVLQHCGSVL